MKEMAMRPNQDLRATAGVYGGTLGTKFGAEDAPFIVTRSLQSADIAVTEVYVDRPPIRLEPNNRFAFLDRGNAYTQKNDLDHAMADYAVNRGNRT